MCPMCLATVVLIAGSVTSTGGLLALALKKFGVNNAVDYHLAHPGPTPERGTDEDAF